MLIVIWSAHFRVIINVIGWVKNSPYVFSPCLLANSGKEWLGSAAGLYLTVVML